MQMRTTVKGVMVEVPSYVQQDALDEVELLLIAVNPKINERQMRVAIQRFPWHSKYGLSSFANTPKETVKNPPNPEA